MLKNLMRDITLAIQARSGFTPALLAWAAIIVVASLTAFAFLCVAGYDWLSLQWGPVYAGLIMAGIFVLIAVIGAIMFAAARRRTKERALLERAARAQATSWWLDPKLLGIAMQAGRTLGWERIIAAALLGLLAALWAREKREPKPDDTGKST